MDGAELRVDPSDGSAYSRAEFVEYYGRTAEWDCAAPAAPGLPWEVGDEAEALHDGEWHTVHVASLCEDGRCRVVWASDGSYSAVWPQSLRPRSAADGVAGSAWAPPEAAAAAESPAGAPQPPAPPDLPQYPDPCTPGADSSPPAGAGSAPSSEGEGPEPPPPGAELAAPAPQRETTPGEAAGVLSPDEAPDAAVQAEHPAREATASAQPLSGLAVAVAQVAAAAALAAAGAAARVVGAEARRLAAARFCAVRAALLYELRGGSPLITAAVVLLGAAASAAATRFTLLRRQKGPLPVGPSDGVLWAPFAVRPFSKCDYYSPLWTALLPGTQPTIDISGRHTSPPAAAAATQTVLAGNLGPQWADGLLVARTALQGLALREHEESLPLLRLQFACGSTSLPGSEAPVSAVVAPQSPPTSPHAVRPTSPVLSCSPTRSQSPYRSSAAPPWRAARSSSPSFAALSPPSSLMNSISRRFGPGPVFGEPQQFIADIRDPEPRMRWRRRPEEPVWRRHLLGEEALSDSRRQKIISSACGNPRAARELLKAAERGDARPFEQLALADPGMRSVRGCTDYLRRNPLHLAATGGHIAVLSACLEPPSQLVERARRARTAERAAAALAVSRPAPDHCCGPLCGRWCPRRELQRSGGGELSPPSPAAARAARDLRRWALRKGDVEALLLTPTGGGLTLLHCAVLSGKLAVVEWLVARIAAIAKRSNAPDLLAQCLAAGGGREGLQASMGQFAAAAARLPGRPAAHSTAVMLDAAQDAARLDLVGSPADYALRQQFRHIATFLLNTWSRCSRRLISAAVVCAALAAALTAAAPPPEARSPPAATPLQPPSPVSSRFCRSPRPAGGARGAGGAADAALPAAQRSALLTQ
eukprot:TRINITY_DN29405_c2_g1_i1.p1 TRINITY_DN29405_c2_g1~~TRINITY_DN29405_c2_g1_i1.p1  ORF type:complete len:905 (+),score=214.78 TRINITY_DN29405_c2_g1_i1:88-2715(+)